MTRLVNLKGRSVELLGYYPCCATVEPPCSLTWAGIADSFLVGPGGAEPPYPIWRKSDFAVPAGVRLLQQVGSTPCARDPDWPHEWWDWEWETVHQCPPTGSGITPCCSLSPFELPRDDRMTLQQELVTCGKLST